MNIFLLTFIVYGFVWKKYATYLGKRYPYASDVDIAGGTGVITIIVCIALVSGSYLVSGMGVLIF